MATFVTDNDNNVESMSMPYNQGDFGTCVAHAFTKVLVDSILKKYGVALRHESIIGAIEAKLPKIFEGHDSFQMCQNWNEKFTVYSMLFSILFYFM